MIDLWDIATFDADLANHLVQHERLIQDCIARENEIFLAHDMGRGEKQSVIRPYNEFADCFRALEMTTAALFDERTIRAWHYCRLVDAEVTALFCDGIHVSTPESLQARLGARIAAGDISHALAEMIVAKSPFNGDQRDNRTGRFYMVSHPDPASVGGVERLLRYWGGEVASFWSDGVDEIVRTLGALGRPRIIEIAVPTGLTGRSHSAASAAIAAHARSVGCVCHSKAFDICIESALPAEAVLHVHSSGDTIFERVGRDYPEGYVDTDLTYWRDLTGEDD